MVSESGRGHPPPPHSSALDLPLGSEPEVRGPVRASGGGGGGPPGFRGRVGLEQRPREVQYRIGAGMGSPVVLA